MSFSFPLNGSPTSQCYNSTDCYRGGQCTVTSGGGGALYCKCPPPYDPLTRCEHSYYDAPNVFAVLVFHSVYAVVASIVFMGLLYPPVKAVIRNVRAKGAKALLPMGPAIVGIVLLAVANVTRSLQFIFRDPLSERVGAVGGTIFCINFVIVQYLLLVIQVRTKQLGDMTRRWRILGWCMLGCGIVGLTAQCASGFIWDPLDRPIMGTIGQVVGLIVPIVVCTSMQIYTIAWAAKQSKKTSRGLAKFWKLLWLCLALNVWMAVFFFLLLAFNRVFPTQLPDVILFMIYVNTTGILTAQALMVAFVWHAATDPPTRQKSSSGAGTTTTTTAPLPPSNPAASSDSNITTQSTAVVSSTTAAPDASSSSSSSSVDSD